MTDYANYYVYAYYDPRNYEMLYVGKGKGSRKNAHKPLKEGSKKEVRLQAIRKAGIKPLIRVVAANLTADQALLVEKTLIWRANGSLTNVSGGHFADNFRLNLNGHSNKDPQRNPVFFNEKSSRILEKKMRSLATRGLKGVRGLGVAELWIRSVG